VRSIATVACLSFLFIGSLGAQTPAATAGSQPGAPTADQLLQRGKDNYRSGHYSEAVDDLRAASGTFLSAAEKQRYIDTGKLETLPQVEQSLVYLALAYAKLGKDSEARDAVMRLANAERIAPTFGTLRLDADAADFQPLVARLTPALTLPQNTQIASGAAAPGQPVEIAQAPAPPPQPAVTSSTPSSAAAPAVAQTTPVAATPQPAPSAPVQTAQSQVVQAAQPQPALSAADRAEMLRLVDERVAEARVEIERDAAAKIAEVQKQADDRVAAGRAAAEKAAEEKIANDRAKIERDADAKIEAARVAAQKATDVKIAEARATAQREAEEKIGAERAAAEQAARAKAESEAAEQRRTMLTGVRQAASLAESGSASDANRAYVRLANATDSPREVIAASAVGLYRTGDYSDAVNAFKRLGTFARGEEDLRYYYAVSLFESGRFDDAKHELSCALPYIQTTADVERYRAKIEGMPSQPTLR
jgi:Tetratricopeptide repeat